MRRRAYIILVPRKRGVMGTTMDTANAPHSNEQPSPDASAPRRRHRATIIAAITGLAVAAVLYMLSGWMAAVVALTITTTTMIVNDRALQSARRRNNNPPLDRGGLISAHIFSVIFVMILASLSWRNPELMAEFESPTGLCVLSFAVLAHVTGHAWMVRLAAQQDAFPLVGGGSVLLPTSRALLPAMLLFLPAFLAITLYPIIRVIVAASSAS